LANLREPIVRRVRSVSEQTDHLVVGADPGSKYDKARLLGFTILDEAQFDDLAPHLEQTGHGQTITDCTVSFLHGLSPSASRWIVTCNRVGASGASVSS